MAHVGLVFVGLILLVNGLVSIGKITPRSAAVLNFMVGGIQILLATLILIQAEGSAQIINSTWPSYLFGMTYLWVGFNTVFALEETAFGWFSGFVAAIALYETALNLVKDPMTAVMWLAWSLMWSCFFVQNALQQTHLGRISLSRFTGWLLVIAGIPSSTIPALFAQNGMWVTGSLAGWCALAALIGCLLLASWQATESSKPQVLTLSSD